MNFLRSAIINFPENRDYIISEDINLSNYNLEIFNHENYLDKEKLPSPLNQMKGGKYWEIKNFEEYTKLLDDIRKIPSREGKRTLKELIQLLTFIIDEKILLCVGKDLDLEWNKNKNYAACIYRQFNSIVINSYVLPDIDRMCASLTHELIHYLQLT